MSDSFQVSAHQLEREEVLRRHPELDAVAFATGHTDSYTGISRRRAGMLHVRWGSEADITAAKELVRLVPSADIPGTPIPIQ